MVIAAVVFGSILTRALGAELSATPPLASEFKTFIERPPRIEELIYQKKLPRDASKPKALETGVQFSTNYQWFQVRWQPEAFFYRQLNSPEAASARQSEGIFTIRSNSDYWDLDTGKRAIFWRETPGEKDESNPVFSGVEDRVRVFAEVLNLGVFNVAPGSITWTGDEFHSQTFIPDVEVWGKLSINPQGRPESMRLDYGRPDNVVTYTLRYGYETNPGISSLPSRIQAFTSQVGKDVEQGEIRILRIKTKAGTVGQELFDPQPYIQENKAELLAFTNRQFFAVTKSGLIPIGKPLPALTPRAIEKYRTWFRPFIYSAFLLFNLTAFALMVRVKLDNQQPKHIKA